MGPRTFIPSSVDSAASQYCARSGATDRRAVSELIRVLRRMGVYDAASLWVFLPGYQATAGAAAFSTGELFAGDGTLVNGPSISTLGNAVGLSLNGTSQYLYAPRAFSGGTGLTVIIDLRMDSVGAAANQSLLGQYTTVTNNRVWQIVNVASASTFRLQLSSSGTGASTTNTDTATTGAATTTNLCVAFTYNAGTVTMMIDGRVATMTGSPPASLFNSSSPFAIGAVGPTPDTPSQWLNGLVRSALVIGQALTEEQTRQLSVAMGTLWNLPQIVWWGDSFTQANHTGWNNSAATVRITPPSQTMNGGFPSYSSRNWNNGVGGETSSQIASRATATTAFGDFIHVIWAGANDKDNTNFSAVADTVQTIINTCASGKYVVLMPHVDSAWTSTQKTNVGNFRTEFLARWPNNTLDTWTQVGQVTSGNINTGYRRYESAGVEDTFHPNNNWYNLLIPKLRQWMSAKGWLPTYDADAEAFCLASGATDIVNISAFVAGVKALGLWNNMVCWPMRAMQNAGTGTTAYSLGGLETNNGTLVSGPTWGPSGITTSATAYVKATYSRTLTATPFTMFGAYTGLTPVISQAYITLGNTGLTAPLAWIGSSGAINTRGFTRNNAYIDVTPPGSFLSTNGAAMVGENVTLIPSSGMLVRSNTWLGTEGAISLNNIACGGALRTSFASAAPATYSIFGYMTTNLTDAQIAAFYALYKSTLGQGLGFP